MKIVYLGSGGFGLEVLEAIRKSGDELAVIVTQAPRPAGRGKKVCSTVVAQWARNNAPGVDLVETEDVNHPAVVEKIAGYHPDVLVVIAFGQKLGAALIAVPSSESVNVHASLLPKYRGAAPINRAIVNGDRYTGISIITLAEKMDAGKILSQSKIEILPDETAEQLEKRLCVLAASVLTDTLKRLSEGSVTYTEQDASGVSYAPRLKKSDGFIDFSEPAVVIRRKILGFWPWPGASAMYVNKEAQKAERVTFAAAVVVDAKEHHQYQPGQFDEELNVVCGEGVLEIKMLKPAGSSLMDFRSFVNGRDVRPADFFKKIE